MPDVNARLIAPAFAPYASELAVFWPQRASATWIAEYNAALQKDPETSPRHQLRADESAYKALAYEQKIFAEHEIPTRANDVHDLMNALVWARFPETKRTLNQRHVEDGATPSGNRRSRLRDGLTLFDEVGIVIFGDTDGALAELHRAHAWSELFHTHRERWRTELTVIVVGHGLLESIAEHEHPGLTGKVLWMGEKIPSAQMDAAIAAQVLSADHAFVDRLRPLPISGIPGWNAGNATPTFYENAAVFRPLSKITK